MKAGDEVLWVPPSGRMRRARIASQDHALGILTIRSGQAFTRSGSGLAPCDGRITPLSDDLRAVLWWQDRANLSGRLSPAAIRKIKEIYDAETAPGGQGAKS